MSFLIKENVFYAYKICVLCGFSDLGSRESASVIDGDFELLGTALSRRRNNVFIHSLFPLNSTSFRADTSQCADRPLARWLPSPPATECMPRSCPQKIRDYSHCSSSGKIPSTSPAPPQRNNGSTAVSCVPDSVPAHGL